MKEFHTILVVDDDKSIVELLQDFLENEGFRVKTAYDTSRPWLCFNRSTFMASSWTS